MKRWLIVLLVLTVVTAVWIRRKAPSTTVVAPVQATNSASAQVTTSPGNASAAGNSTKQKLLAALVDEYTKPDDTVARLERSWSQAKTVPDKMRLLGQARDHHIARADALRMLREHLTDPDASVRVYAASLLLEFGSSEGRPVLLAVMKSALDPASHLVTDAVTAATALNRYREVIPPDLLADLYQRTSHPELLSIMATQGDPRYTPFLLEAAKMDPIAGNIEDLGLLRATEAADYVRQIYATTTDPRTKATAAWSLYRLNADNTALSYVFDVAARGMAPAGTADDAEAGLAAIRDLAVTASPAVRDFLRQNVETARTDINCQALASLYYVQHDYVFIDDYLQRFLTSPETINNVDSNMLWKMVFSREQPNLLALAQAKRPDAFAYYQGQLRGRSADTWIWQYLSNIPLR